MPTDPIADAVRASPLSRNDDVRRLARVERLYRALTTTVEAILRAPSPQVLFDSVCDASVEGGRFVASTVFLHEPGAPWLDCVAGAGVGSESIVGVHISIDPALVEGRGIVGEAFRTATPCIASDIPNDERFDPRRREVRAADARAAAAFPLMQDGRCTGALVYYSNEPGEFDDEMVSLLQRMSTNVSFALDRFEQEARRAVAEAAQRRARRMYSTLSAVNEAIMRVTTPQALFDAVCHAAVGAEFVLAAVLQPEHASSWLKVIAIAGGDTALRRLAQAPISVDAHVAQGRGTAGSAFRSGVTQVANDYLNDERLHPWHEQARAGGVRASAAVPLVHGGRPVGVLLFFARDVDAFDADAVALLERLSANVSFALASFDREAERRVAQERIEHLATHDALTGLPNRAMFHELLKAAVRSARRYGRALAVLYIDLDGFKAVNDSLEHAAGDVLLQTLSERFRGVLRSSDAVARVGGDEFIALVHEVETCEQLEPILHKLLRAAEDPVPFEGGMVNVSASIGVALYRDGPDDEAALVKQADKALYRAKQQGKNTFEFHP